METIKKTTILTGFLGAGKTTYLNHLLKSKPNTKFAIIENEFGEQSIDGELIIRSTDNILEMNNGCLCCSLNEGLYDLLCDLHERSDEFDELIIEATGVADPVGIAEPFITNTAVKGTFRLNNTICLVDAEQIEDQLRETEEARQQIAFSDVLLINKTDLVSASYVEELKKILQGINPNATVLVKDKDFYPEVSDTITITGEHIPEKVNSCSHQSHTADCGHHHHHEDKAAKHVHTHKHTDIVTHSFVVSVPIDLQMLYQQLFVFLTFQAKDMYRVKGIIYADGSDAKHVIQSVGKRLGMEEIGQWKKGEVKESKVVFIGKNIKPEGLRKLLDKCTKKDSVHL